MKLPKLVEDERTGTVDAEDADALLSRILGQTATSRDGYAFGGILIGELLEGTDGSDAPCVRFPGQGAAAPIPARATVDLAAARAGQRVVLVFENADPAKPIIIGVVREQHFRASENADAAFEVEADGKRLSIVAREQLVLRCGESSITLTKAGKVLIKGEYVSSRSNGVNRIKGGSVQIN